MSDIPICCVRSSLIILSKSGRRVLFELLTIFQPLILPKFASLFNEKALKLITPIVLWGWLVLCAADSDTFLWILWLSLTFTLKWQWQRFTLRLEYSSQIFACSWQHMMSPHHLKCSNQRQPDLCSHIQGFSDDDYSSPKCKCAPSVPVCELASLPVFPFCPSQGKRPCAKGKKWV